MTDYDNTNRGALFEAANRNLIRQGKVDFAGDEEEIAIVKAITKNNKTIFEVYQKIGVVFVNENRSENAPGMSGPVEFKGREFKMAGWAKKSKDDRPYTSISVEPQGEHPDTSPGEQQQPDPDPKDEIPF